MYMCMFPCVHMQVSVNASGVLQTSCCLCAPATDVNV